MAGEKMSWSLDVMIPRCVRMEMSHHGGVLCVGDRKGLEAEEGGRVGDIKGVEGADWRVPG